MQNKCTPKPPRNYYKATPLNQRRPVRHDSGPDDYEECEVEAMFEARRLELQTTNPRAYRAWRMRYEEGVKATAIPERIGVSRATGYRLLRAADALMGPVEQLRPDTDEARMKALKRTNPNAFTVWMLGARRMRHADIAALLSEQWGRTVTVRQIDYLSCKAQAVLGRARPAGVHRLHRVWTWKPSRDEQQRWFEEQDGKCAYCQTPIADYWEIEHIIPHLRGGLDCEENLTLSCADCNARKWALPLPEFLRRNPHFDVRAMPVKVRKVLYKYQQGLV